MRAVRMRTQTAPRRTPDQPAAPDTEPTAEPAVIEPAQDHNDPAQLRAAADRLRTHLDHAAAQAETLLAEARETAARLVADAQARARELTADRSRGEQLLRDLEERAQYLDHAAAQRAQAEAAEDQAAALTAEAADLTEQIAALDARLAELGEQRENAGAHLAAARDAGDVAAVAAARTEMAAVDEVTAALTGRRGALAARLAEIGERDDVGGRGELPAALARAQAARAEVRRIENLLDPDRIEAVLDQATADLRAFAQNIAQGTA